MDDLDDIAVLFAMDDGDDGDDGENNRNNALRLILDEFMEPELDELEVRQRGDKTRNQNYYEITIPQYDDILFKEHFRMSRATFEVYFMKLQTRIKINSNILFFKQIFVGFSQRNWSCHTWESELPCRFKKKSYVLNLGFG